MLQLQVLMGLSGYRPGAPAYAASELRLAGHPPSLRLRRVKPSHSDVRRRFAETKRQKNSTSSVSALCVSGVEIDGLWMIPQRSDCLRWTACSISMVYCAYNASNNSPTLGASFGDRLLVFRSMFSSRAATPGSAADFSPNPDIMALALVIKPSNCKLSRVKWLISWLSWPLPSSISRIAPMIRFSVSATCSEYSSIRKPFKLSADCAILFNTGSSILAPAEI